MAVLWAMALAVLIPLHLWWRRRGPPQPARSAAGRYCDPPLSRWADAGEYRAVANVAAARLRATVATPVPGAHAGLDTERLLAELAAVRPHWPLTELATVLRKLDDARFGSPAHPTRSSCPGPRWSSGTACCEMPHEPRPPLVAAGIALPRPSGGGSGAGAMSLRRATAT